MDMITPSEVDVALLSACDGNLMWSTVLLQGYTWMSENGLIQLRVNDAATSSSLSIISSQNEAHY